MSNKIALPTGVMAAALVVFLAVGAAAQSLSNGDFESWTGVNVANNWTSYLTSGGIACYKGSTFTGIPVVTPHGGLECQRVKLTSSTGAPSQGGVYQRFASTAGTTYTVRAYILTRLTNAPSCDGMLGVDPSGATAPGGSTVWSNSVSGDSIWIQKTVSVTATGAYVTVFLNGKHATGDTTQCNVFFDDVTVCVSPAAPTNPAASPATISTGDSCTLSATAPGGCTIDWFTGSCGQTLVGSGTSLAVNPLVTTTYFARSRNTSTDCPSSTCAQVTVNVVSRNVTITPSNMAEYGWQIATSNGGTCTFTLGGPVASEYVETPTFPAGRGALYMTCKEISGLGSNPSTAWIGLDKLWVSPGVFKSLELIRLDQIKKLVYKTYVPTIPTHLVYITNLNYPRQPIHLSIVTEDSGPPYLDRNWYLNMPFPHNEMVFNNEYDRFGHWDRNQPIPHDGTTAGWYCVDPKGKWDTWEDMCADNAIGTKKLVPTSTYWDPRPALGSACPDCKDMRGWKSCGYVEDLSNPANSTNPPGAAAATGTGTALNFYVGARDDAADLSAWYDEPWTPWWKESYGFRGYLDEVTIGVEFDDIGYVETTYDFEPEPDTPDLVTVAMSQVDAILPTGTGVYKTYQPMLSTLLNRGGSGPQKLGMRVKVFGRVLHWQDSPSGKFGSYFDLWDGSVPIDVDNYDPPHPWHPEEISKEVAPQGVNLWQRPLPIRVHVPNLKEGQWPPDIGDYWSAIGYPVVLGWGHPIPEPAMQGGWNETEVCGQIILFSNIENCRKIAP